ncbi:MAG TPA: ABC-type transport auxiliary lipoprotein family protein [Asticcacaulis sp.]
MKHARIIALFAVGLTLGLGGCVNVLPKVKPVQLYRFGYHPDLLKDKDAAAAAATTTAAPVPLMLGAISFPPASAGDQVMTTEDNEVSYVAQARWASSASALFAAAVSEGFARSDQTVMLVPRGPTAADYRLDVSVRRFEASYSHGRPTVYIGVDARLLRLSDRSVLAQRYISASVSVRRNDMTLISQGFDQATTEVVAGLTGFADASLKKAAPPPTPTQPGDKGRKVEGL